jgi:hypothetical protein
MKSKQNDPDDPSAIQCPWCGSPELYGNNRCGYCGHNPLTEKAACDCSTCQRVVRLWRKQKRQYQNVVLRAYRHIWPRKRRERNEN